MAITASVAVSQTSLAPNEVTLTDESTGTDATITKRRVFITDSEGNYLVENGTTTQYEEWNDFPATTTITLDVLTEDKAVHLLVQYLTSANVVVTTFEDDYSLSEYNKQFFYEVWQQQGLTPGIYQDLSYESNLAKLWINIVGGIQAIEIGSDLSASQNCMNRATDLRLNEDKYF